MSSRTDIREIADYVGKLLAATRPDSVVGRKLSGWIREHETLLGIDYRAIVDARAKPGAKKRADDKPLSAAVWKKLSGAVASRRAGAHSAPLARNVSVLASVLQLSDLETAIFTLVAMTSYESALDNLCELISETRIWTAEELIGILLGAHPADAGAALSRGPLASMKLIDGVGDRPGRFGLYIPYRILDSLRPPVSGLEEIERVLLGSPVKSRLHWSDFDYIAPERDFAARLLRGAIAQTRRGINILLYGPPGTGKTELAKIIAQEVDAILYSVGECDEDGDEPTRYDRLSALRLNGRLLNRRRNACLLFDEMEDLLEKGDAANIGGRRIRRAGSKVFLNRLLEQNNVPIIWTANCLNEFDPAFLRRMSFAFEMKTSARRVRARVWLRAAEQQNVALDADAADSLAQHHAIAPSLTQSAMQAVSVAGVPAEKLEFVVSRLAKAAEGAVAKNLHAAIPCDPELLNADRDLSALERNLPQASRMISFCLYGPSGTGKSAYARRLAERMNLDVLEKKGSDFLSKWVGETEQRIAAAFEEAAAEERFLIIDEAESLFWSRAGATHSWEASMVNEFLTNLEKHAFPVACTTNELAHFDVAALRRFTFKLKLDFLAPGQLEKAFEKFFGLAAPAAIRQLHCVSLGDFAVVKKQLRYLEGATHARDEIVALLAAEAAAKRQSAQRIGF